MGEKRKQVVCQHALGHCHVDETALPGGARLIQRGEHRGDGTHRAAEQIADLQRRNRRRPVRRAGLFEDSGLGDVIQIMPGAQCPRAILPVAGDGAIDGAGLRARRIS